MGFFRQGYRSRLPFPSPRDLPGPGIEPTSLTLQTDSLPSEPRGKSQMQRRLSPILHEDSSKMRSKGNSKSNMKSSFSKKSKSLNKTTKSQNQGPVSYVESCPMAKTLPQGWLSPWSFWQLFEKFPAREINLINPKADSEGKIQVLSLISLSSMSGAEPYSPGFLVTSGTLCPAQPAAPAGRSKDEG